MKKRAVLIVGDVEIRQCLCGVAVCIPHIPVLPTRDFVYPLSPAAKKNLRTVIIDLMIITLAT